MDSIRPVCPKIVTEIYTPEGIYREGYQKCPAVPEPEFQPEPEEDPDIVDLSDEIDPSTPFDGSDDDGPSLAALQATWSDQETDSTDGGGQSLPSIEPAPEETAEPASK